MPIIAGSLHWTPLPPTPDARAAPATSLTVSNI